MAKKILVYSTDPLVFFEATPDSLTPDGRVEMSEEEYNEWKKVQEAFFEWDDKIRERMVPLSIICKKCGGKNIAYLEHNRNISWCEDCMAPVGQ